MMLTIPTAGRKGRADGRTEYVSLSCYRRERKFRVYQVGRYLPVGEKRMGWMGDNIRYKVLHRGDQQYRVGLFFLLRWGKTNSVHAASSSSK